MDVYANYVMQMQQQNGYQQNGIAATTSMVQNQEQQQKNISHYSTPPTSDPSTVPASTVPVVKLVAMPLLQQTGKVFLLNFIFLYYLKLHPGFCWPGPAKRSTFDWTWTAKTSNL